MLLGAPGTVTTIGTMLAVSGGAGGSVTDTLYTVDVPVKLFETHHGIDGPWTSPQAFRRFESGTGASKRG